MRIVHDEGDAEPLEQNPAEELPHSDTTGHQFRCQEVEPSFSPGQCFVGWIVLRVRIDIVRCISLFSETVDL